jgi:DNA-directed RNA polymerase I and III subunit RPAC1
LDDENPVPPFLATRFRDCFSPGVINIDPDTKEVSVDKHGVRGETMSREVLRHPDLAKFVKLARVRDHFICAFSFSCAAGKVTNILMHRSDFSVSVESEGPYEPQRLPLEAIRVMREKISVLKVAAETLRAQGDPDGDVQMADT